MSILTSEDIQNQIDQLEATWTKLIVAKEAMENNPQLSFEEVQAAMAQQKTESRAGDTESQIADTNDGDVEMDEEEEEQDLFEDFMGENPAKESNLKLDISKALAQRVTTWIKEGINKENKKEKLKILETIPRRGDNLNLEPPALDQGINSAKIVTNDNFMKDYSNLATGSLAAVLQVLNDMVNDDAKPINRSDTLERMSAATKLLCQLCYELTSARRHKVMFAYDEKAQKLMKRTQPKEFLFDGKIKALIDEAQVLEKSFKHLQPKKSTPLSNRSNSLNWDRSPNSKKSGGGASNLKPRVQKQQQSTSQEKGAEKKPYSKKEYPAQPPRRR